MPFKFEKLEVWKRSLEYLDLAYDIGNALPSDEAYNLRSQLVRAATSVALNIAEGSTGQTDLEQARFLGMAIRQLHLSKPGYVRIRPSIRQMGTRKKAGDRVFRPSSFVLRLSGDNYL